MKIVCDFIPSFFTPSFRSLQTLWGETVVKLYSFALWQHDFTAFSTVATKNLRSSAGDNPNKKTSVFLHDKSECQKGGRTPHASQKPHRPVSTPERVEDIIPHSLASCTSSPGWLQAVTLDRRIDLYRIWHFVARTCFTVMSVRLLTKIRTNWLVFLAGWIRSVFERVFHRPNVFPVGHSFETTSVGFDLGY